MVASVISYVENMTNHVNLATIISTICIIIFSLRLNVCCSNCSIDTGVREIMKSEFDLMIYEKLCLRESLCLITFCKFILFSFSNCIMNFTLRCIELISCTNLAIWRLVRTNQKIWTIKYLLTDWIELSISANRGLSLLVNSYEFLILNVLTMTKWTYL